MSNYTPTGAPPVETRGISVSIRSEFQLIAAAIASKADSSGSGGYTGTQDFTSATILVPTLNYGSSGNNAASVNYVNNAIFQAVLPGQTGNAGSFLMTNGTAASWGATLGIALNEAKASAPTLSATPDIWNAAGNYVPITQTTSITGFPNAPQPGARRTLQIGANITIVSGANLTVHGGTRALVTGDEVDVIADTVSTFIATVRLASGTATVPVVYQRADQFLTSGVFVAKVTGPHRLILVAPTGSAGAVLTNGSNAGGSASATGSGAGGISFKYFNATIGDTFVVTIGAPGAGYTLTALPSSSNGNAGGNCSVTGPNLSVSVTAGGPGHAYIGNVAASHALVGGIGGTATGGDENYSGGNGGSTSSLPAGSGSTTYMQATGGGAVAYKGVTYSAGNITVQTGYIQAATGGAGVGGASGSILPTAVSGSNTFGVTGGGGSNGAGTNSTTPGQLGAAGAGISYATLVPFNITGQGQTPTAGISVSSAEGGAGSGVTSPSYTSSNSVAAATLGAFAGGGGICFGDGTTTGIGINGASGFLGGGAGAIVVWANSGVVNTITIPSGSSGMALFEYA